MAQKATVSFNQKTSSRSQTGPKTAIIKDQEDISNVSLDNNFPPVVVSRMLEDTGGSSDNNVKNLQKIQSKNNQQHIKHQQQIRLFQAPLTTKQKKDKNNLISGSNLIKQTTTTVLKQKANNQNYGRQQKQSNIDQTKNKINETYAPSMSQFSRIGDLSNSDLSIKGRKLSPNTACGNNQASGSESGVRLTVNQTDQLNHQAQRQQQKNVNNAIQSYSSEYLQPSVNSGAAIGKYKTNSKVAKQQQSAAQAPQQQQVMRSAKQPRSTSLLRHRQQVTTSETLQNNYSHHQKGVAGVLTRNQQQQLLQLSGGSLANVQTGHFAAPQSTSVTAQSQATMTKQSQSAINLHQSVAQATVNAAAHKESGHEQQQQSQTIKKRRDSQQNQKRKGTNGAGAGSQQSQLMRQQSRKEMAPNSYLPSEIPVGNRGSVQKNFEKYSKNPHTASTNTLKPPKSSKPEPILKKSSSRAAIVPDMIKKKRQSAASSIQRKPNAIANQKLMAQQKSAALFNNQGNKSVSHIQRAGINSLNRSKSPMNLSSQNHQHYQSVGAGTDKVKSITAVSFSLKNRQNQHQASQQQLQLQQSQQLNNRCISNNVQAQRNESGGTGELTIRQSKPQRGSSSSSSPNTAHKHHQHKNQNLQHHQYNTTNAVVNSKSQQNIIQAGAAAEAQQQVVQNQLKNSKSSFQLTFSQQTSSVQPTASQAKATLKIAVAQNKNVSSSRGRVAAQWEAKNASSPEFMKTNSDNHHCKLQPHSPDTNIDRKNEIRSRGNALTKKTHAISHSPHNRSTGSITHANHGGQVSAWSKGEALRIYKELQKKMVASDPPTEFPGSNKGENSSRASITPLPLPPYMNMIQYQSKSAINFGSGRDTKNQSSISNTISQQNDSVLLEKQQQDPKLKMMRKLLGQQKQQPESKQPRKQKKNLNIVQGKFVIDKYTQNSGKQQKRSYSPSGRPYGTAVSQLQLLQQQNQQQSVVTLTQQQQHQLQLQQSKKERKDQKQRMKDLRSKRKAIEAKTREMKQKSIKNQQAQLMTIAPSGKQQQQSMTALTQTSFGGGKASVVQKSVPQQTDLQKINSMKPVTKVAPQKYTVVRSNLNSELKSSNGGSGDLLNSFGYQKHQNMPLKVKSTMEQQNPVIVERHNQQQNQYNSLLPRHRSNSSERVEWDPIAKSLNHNGGATVRQKGNLNVRSSKREALGLDYLRVKRELAAELPLAGGPKKLKYETPTMAAATALPLNHQILTSRTQNKKKVQKIQQQNHNSSIDPKILVSERKSLASNYQMKEVPSQSIEQSILECDRQQNQPKEKQKNLVEQHKRQWIQKERQQQITQLSEQQRILKNLQHVNKVAWNQAQKASSRHQQQSRGKEKVFVVPSTQITSSGNDRIIKSARIGQKQREKAINNVLSYKVSQYQENSLTPTSLEGRKQLQKNSSSLKKQQARGDKDESADDMINVQIRSFSEEPDDLNFSANMKRIQVEAYSSPIQQMQLVSGTTGEADSESKSIQERRSNHALKKNAERMQGRQDPRQDRFHLKLNPATLYQLNHADKKLSINDENLRHSSQSQRQSMSQSSNLNYSPTTTIEKRSNSQSTTNGIVLRSESPSKSRGNSRGRVRSNKLKSASSKTSKKKFKVQKEANTRKKIISQFGRNQCIREWPQPQISHRQAKSISEDLEKEDLVIYIILTQAARMIQKAFRQFLIRKNVALSKEQFRHELENELEEARSNRAQIRTIDNPTGISNSIANTIQSPNDPSAANINQVKASLALKKHTFSFGQVESKNNFKNSRTHIKAGIQHQKSAQATPAGIEYSLISSNGDGRIHILSGRQGQEKAKKLHENQQSKLQSAHDTANFEQASKIEQHSNAAAISVQIQGSQNDERRQQQTGDEGADYEVLNMDAGSDSHQDDRDDDTDLHYEKVESPLKRIDQRLQYQQNIVEEDSAAKDAQEHDKEMQGAQEEQVDQSQCTDDDDQDEIRSHILAEAGEDISLQHILDEQKRSVDESMMGSVAERTDNIINYSGALNTSEEFIENTVNVSGTLGPINNTNSNNNNPYSIVSSASKPAGSKLKSSSSSQSQQQQHQQQSGQIQQQLQQIQAIQAQSKVDPVQQKTEVVSSAPPLKDAVSNEGSPNTSFDYQVMLNNHVDITILSNQSKTVKKAKNLTAASSNSYPATKKDKKYTDQSRKSLMRVISGDEKFLINQAKLANEYTNNTETQKEALQIISQLNSGLGTQAHNSIGSVNENEYNLKTFDNSFQNALYPPGMQSNYLQQNLSQVSIEQHDKSQDSITLLKQNYHITNAAGTLYNNSQSFFLNTNASIFERNPFQDFTASKINNLLNGKGQSSDPQNLEQLIQVKEDALKFITQLEKGWIARQEKLSILTPKQSNKKRYELEQWVTNQRTQAAKVPKKSTDGGEAFSPSATQVRHFCQQVSAIVSNVNHKADEIREQLYLRSQDQAVKKQQIEGYQAMHIYKRALGIGAGKSDDQKQLMLNDDINQLDNIDIIDQSQENIKVEIQVEKKQAEAAPDVVDKVIEQEIATDLVSKNDGLDISLDEDDDDEDQGMKSPPQIETASVKEVSAGEVTKSQDKESQQLLPLNSDLPTQKSPPIEDDSESIKSEVNEKLTEEITDRILAQVLQEELKEGDLKLVFNRQMPRIIPLEKSNKSLNSPGGSRVRNESVLEVAVTSDKDFNINQSISVDQIIAGVDTSMEAVDQYVEGIFTQIRVRAKQFMNAFYTPIYRNPMTMLTKIQKQSIGTSSAANPDEEGALGTNPVDMSNTLSSILNVQLYLTLEKARENVIREALQQIKDAAAEGEDLAIDSNLSELLSESDHIHNKAIFDAVNEALNLVRPYGRLGEPMPWSNRARKNFFPYAGEKDLEGILQIVKKCILDWANIRAGQISSNMIIKSPESNKYKSPEKPPLEEYEAPSGSNKVSNNSSGVGAVDENGEVKSEAGVIRQAAFQQISEETLAIQREKRLAKLLTQEIKAQEERWLDYEYEETQVKVDITDHLLEQLVEEVVNELQTIQASKKN